MRTFQVECPALGIKNITVYGPKTDFYPVKGKAVSCIDISPNGNLFAAGNGDEVTLGSVTEGKSQTILKGHLSDVTTVQFFPSNLVVLTGGADFQVKIWSVLNGSNPVTLQGHTSAITSTAIIAQGRNVLSSSRDGTVKLWNCGTSSTIATMGHYQFPVNKMILAKLPSQYEPATTESLDPLEVDTADKLVIVALGDGSVRGIHLGTKKEIFATPATDVALTAVAYEGETGTIFTGNANGLVQVFSIQKSLQEPHVAWSRNGHAITSLVTKLSSNGETVLCISAADGSVYQTGSLNSLLRSNSAVYVEAEYTGSELEPVYDMKVMSSGHESGYQRIACAVRDGKVKIY
ncbi:WD40-repeat-containing domain protein [Mucor mucedo]|uniref:WD40-repeat-containing domain protein n=1 Tax=Mucor mucedo TaxID=29922 RepID=UPI00221F710E|nr:WD40-repeat-containing domain protein [Mucor mucedo]KAI7879857.1 WD40-repeat-containing domain protein [Mucor mucedo]